MINAMEIDRNNTIRLTGYEGTNPILLQLIQANKVPYLFDNNPRLIHIFGIFCCDS